MKRVVKICTDVYVENIGNVVQVLNTCESIEQANLLIERLRPKTKPSTFGYRQNGYYVSSHEGKLMWKCEIYTIEVTDYSER